MQLTEITVSPMSGVCSVSVCMIGAGLAPFVTSTVTSSYRIENALVSHEDWSRKYEAMGGKTLAVRGHVSCPGHTTQSRE